MPGRCGEPPGTTDELAFHAPSVPTTAAAAHTGEAGRPWVTFSHVGTVTGMSNIWFKSGTVRTASRAVAVSGAVCIVLAACSSDAADPVATTAVSSGAAVTTAAESTAASSQPAASDGSVTSAPADTTPAATVPATAAIDAEADQAAAAATLLVLSDFNKGWSEVPGDRSENVKDVQRAVAKCAGSDEDTTIDFGGAKAEAGNFKSPNDEAVNETVSFAPSVDAATERMANLDSPEFAICIHDVYEFAARGILEDSGASLEGITIGKLNVAPVGDGTVAFRVMFSASKGGATQELYNDTVVIRSGRVVASLNFQSSFSPFEISETERLVALASGRMTGV